MSDCKGKSKGDCIGECIWVHPKNNKHYCRKRPKKITPITTNTSSISSSGKTPKQIAIQTLKNNFEILQRGLSKETRVESIVEDFNSVLSVNDVSNPHTIYFGIVSIIENKWIIDNYISQTKLITISSNREILIRKYHIIHNKLFKSVLKQVIQSFSLLDIQSFQKGLISIINTNDLSAFAYTIYDMLIRIIDENTSPDNYHKSKQVAENVQSSEDIQALGLKDFDGINKNFTNFSNFDKNSASDSIIITANLKSNITNNFIKELTSLRISKTYYFKIYPTHSDYTKNVTVGLKVERLIYENIFKLSQYNITPNVLCKVATGSFDNFNKFFEDTTIIDKQKILRTMNQINNGVGVVDGPWKEVGFILTNPGGPNLRAAFSTLTSEQRRQVFFQIFYTLYVFDKFEISQGDLHTGNLFITDVPPTELIYHIRTTNGTSHNYKFTTTKLVKIYDFDHGMIAKRTELKQGNDIDYVNKITNSNRTPTGVFNKRFGETMIYNPKFDKIILLAWGLVYGKSYSDKINLNILDEKVPDQKEFNDFIREVYPGFYIHNPISNYTIKKVYKDLSTNSKDLKELNRLYDIKNVDTPFDTSLDSYEIEDQVKKATWLIYYKGVLCQHYGRALKSSDHVVNNHLWIPDNIVISNEDTLQLPYFDSLKTLDSIDIRKNIIYTVEKKIVE